MLLYVTDKTFFPASSTIQTLALFHDMLQAECTFNEQQARLSKSSGLNLLREPKKLQSSRAFVQASP
jgi:hypothetical protein